jgi:hypothetical protein
VFLKIYLYDIESMKCRTIIILNVKFHNEGTIYVPLTNLLKLSAHCFPELLKKLHGFLLEMTPAYYIVSNEVNCFSLV